MKRELVVQFNGGRDHIFPLNKQHNEDELREFFQGCMAGDQGKIVTWGGSTFNAHAIVCFYFRDHIDTNEHIKLQRRAVELLEKEAGHGEDWKGE